MTESGLGSVLELVLAVRTKVSLRFSSTVRTDFTPAVVPSVCFGCHDCLRTLRSPPWCLKIKLSVRLVPRGLVSVMLSFICKIRSSKTCLQVQHFILLFSFLQYPEVLSSPQVRNLSCTEGPAKWNINCYIHPPLQMQHPVSIAFS